MAHSDAGKYSAKHSSDRKLNQKVSRAIEKTVVQGKISCADAAKLADELTVSMGEIGFTVDLMEIRITKCQLGLFGYESQNGKVIPAKSVHVDLEKAIHASSTDGRLACVASWEIAKRFNIPKTDVSSACEALNIKIKPCQLGAF